jgi:hypothetical protein
VKQTAVAPVEAGRFDKAFAYVARPGTHTANEEGFLQKIAISDARLVVNSKRGGEIRVEVAAAPAADAAAAVAAPPPPP